MNFATACVALLLASTAAGSEKPLALRGFDPVALCEGTESAGSRALVESFGRYQYRFTNETNRARFAKDPERFCIQWSGACGRMGPLSGRGSADRWAVHDGHVYIFASDGCREGFLAAPERFAVKPERRPDSTPEAIAEGNAWIKRAVAAHGGATAIQAKRGLRLMAEGVQSEWAFEREVVVTSEGHVFRRSSWTPPEPDKERSETAWVVGDFAFTLEDDVVFDLCASERADVRRFGHREPIALLWARHRKEMLAVHRGPGKLGDVAVVDVVVRVDGLNTTLHLDPKDGRILGLSWRGRPNDGATRDVVETFTRWRTIDGVLVPAERQVTVDGEDKPSLAGAWDTLELLDEPPSDNFKRPEPASADER